MFDAEYLWPEPGCTFFQSIRTRPGAYTWNCASLGEYAYMYREGAEKLIELACNAPPVFLMSTPFRPCTCSGTPLSCR